MTGSGLPVEFPKPRTVEKLRCWRCNQMLAWKITAPYKIQCKRCKAMNQA